MNRGDVELRPMTNRWNKKPVWWGKETFGGLPNGRSARTNPKTRRPFIKDRAQHIVMRSLDARGLRSFRHARNFERVQIAFRKTAARYGVKLHKTATVGNHLHLLISARDRNSFANFLRKLAATIACLISGAKRGKPAAKFWAGRPFSRLLDGGAQAFWRAESYVILNSLEAVGILPPRSLARLGPPGDGRRTRLLKLARALDAEVPVSDGSPGSAWI